MYSLLADYIDLQRDAVVDIQRHLTAIPAICPSNGGIGEEPKAKYIKDYLEGLGFGAFRDMNAPDDRVPSGFRPNFAAILHGQDTSRTLWVISHMDVVPVGDLSLWESDPFEIQVDGDIIAGRGVEDNQQAIVSVMLAAKSFIDNGITPDINLGMIFVADEETGSKFGLEYIVENHEDLFADNDLFLIPDYGAPDGSMIEVAEKTQLWVKVTVLGKQCHASSPERGNNSLVAAADFILRVRDLYEAFPDQEEMFSPPFSTFEPTKKEANVENINTVPGRDVFYVDCRVLPCYDIDDVMDRFDDIADEVSSRFEVEVEIEKLTDKPTPPATAVDSEIVTRLASSIQDVLGVTARPCGIGGGTVAAFLREKGYPTAVWATLLNTCHQPNEISSIKNTIGDAKVIAHMLSY